MEKRKLKYMYQRMPKKALNWGILNKELSARTGYSIKDIGNVIDEFGELLKESIKEKKSIYIPGIGTLYPTIKPGKNVVKINNFKEEEPELMYMPARWVCKFKVKPSFAKDLLKVELSEEEVNNIYRD